MMQLDPDSMTPSPNNHEFHLSEESLTVHNANWFLNLLENDNLLQLGEHDRSLVVQSTLRVKPKHRTAVLFDDDVRFVLYTEHNLRAPNNGEFGKGCPDVRVWYIRESCKFVVQHFRNSLENAPARSCIWSALMHRAAYHLIQSRIEGIELLENNAKTKEACLVVQGHSISRSNFTKIARQLTDELGFNVQ